MTQKRRDKHGRWRSKIIAFRASIEEAKLIDEAVALSGLTKQEYIITRLLNIDVTVIGNPRVFVRLKSKMDAIYSELLRLTSHTEINEELNETLKLVASIYYQSMQQNEETNS